MIFLKQDTPTMISTSRLSAKRRQRGLTLIELMIAMSLGVLITGISLTALTRSFKTQSYLGAHNQLKQYAESALYQLSSELAQAKQLFYDDAQGRAFLQKMDLTQTPASVPISLLPVVRSNGSAAPEMSCQNHPERFFWAPSVGNSLFFARQAGVFDGFEGLGGGVEARAINLYQFVYVYLAPNTEYPLAHLDNKPSSLELLEWRSVLFADYEAVQSYLNAAGVGPTERNSILNRLQTQARAVGLWQVSQDNPNQAFYQLNSALDAHPANYRIPQRQVQNVLRWTSSSQNVYSVARNGNGTPGPEFFPIQNQVPRFYASAPTPDCGTLSPAPLPATNSRPNADYPHGFEVIVTGPSSGRSVHIHLTVVNQNQHPRMIEHQHGLSAYARDL